MLKVCVTGLLFSAYTDCSCVDKTMARIWEFVSLGCCLVRILTVPVLKVCVTGLLFSAYTDCSCVESLCHWAVVYCVY